MSISEKMQKCHEFVIALEEERRKIQVFQRELPLCLELVTQAIETYRRELSGTTTEYIQGNSDCSDQTSSGAPVLEEFIPINREDSERAKAKVRESDSEEDDEDDVDHHHEEEQRWSNKRRKSADSSSGDSAHKDDNRKSDWLRSAQLWKEPSDPSLASDRQEVLSKSLVTEVGGARKGGAFQPFQRDKNKNDNLGCSNTDTTLNKVVSSCPCPSSSAETVASERGGSARKEDKDANQQRKQRRCWSPELHRRFLQALQQLGGSHVATPKQIRELMKVDGLTNDEVKSHLQKYRLHTRRPSPSIQSGGSPQPPQFVVVGGIWVPPPEFSATVAAVPNSDTATLVGNKAIYAPVASAPAPSSKATAVSTEQESVDQQLLPTSERDGSLGAADAGQSDSASTSSSSRTATPSPVQSV